MHIYEAQVYIKENFKRIMNSYEIYIKATINTGSIEDIYDIADDIIFMKEFRKNGWDIDAIYLKDAEDKEEEEAENTGEIGE